MHRHSFLTTARTALDLASCPEVAAAWTLESSCAGMSVGGLTAHLLKQASLVVDLLDVPPGDRAPIGVLDHYARAAWVTASHDDQANVEIREGADASATSGPDAVLEAAHASVDGLAEVLERPRTPDTVLVIWQGWTLSTDDFLVTRAMELVVHSDDLASSVGLPTPEFPADVVDTVLALLAAVAARRHGQASVVRALSRPQRAPASVSAF